MEVVNILCKHSYFIHYMFFYIKNISVLHNTKNIILWLFWNKILPYFLFNLTKYFASTLSIYLRNMTIKYNHFWMVFLYFSAKLSTSSNYRVGSLTSHVSKNSICRSWLWVGLDNEYISWKTEWIKNKYSANASSD